MNIKTKNACLFNVKSNSADGTNIGIHNEKLLFITLILDFKYGSS